MAYRSAEIIRSWISANCLIIKRILKGVYWRKNLFVLLEFLSLFVCPLLCVLFLHVYIYPCARAIRPSRLLFFKSLEYRLPLSRSPRDGKFGKNELPNPESSSAEARKLRFRGTLKRTDDHPTVSSYIETLVSFIHKFQHFPCVSCQSPNPLNHAQ